MDKQWLMDAENTLKKLVANILQVSHKDSSMLANAIIAKASGAAAAAGTLGVIGTFGTASTGTAIAGLSGAAASNATLFWVGSLVGGGVAAGAIVTGGIGIVAGYFGLRWWKGEPRNPNDLSDEEKAIVEASLGLVKAFREQQTSKLAVGKVDARFILEEAWSPLVDRVKDYDKYRAVKTVNLKNNLGLRSRCIEMDDLTRRLQGMNSITRINQPAAVTLATVFANLINKAPLSFSADERLVIDALRRSSNALKDMSLPEMGDYLRSLDEDALRGLGNNVKGIYHELQFVRRENLDGDGVTARIFPETNHPGADVVLTYAGEDIVDLQLKATDNAAIVKEHIERYPDIPIAATDEVAGSVPGVQGSDFSNIDLDRDTREVIGNVSDQAHIIQLTDAAVTSGLIAAAINVGNILAGKATAKEASRAALRDVGVAVTSTMLIGLLFS